MPGYLLAGGFCPTVGVSGFHHGGGVGALTREFGLGVDNVLQFTMVTVNGTMVVIANATQNVDLFWAVRGKMRNVYSSCFFIVFLLNTRWRWRKFGRGH
jgi:FAD/FMN-containing dehydrogenase